MTYTWLQYPLERSVIICSSCGCINNRLLDGAFEESELYCREPCRNIKPLFHRNYLEQYVPGILIAGTFFPPDLLLSAFPLRSKVSRFVLGLHISQYQVRKFRTCILGSSDFTRLGSVNSRRRNDASPVILQMEQQLNVSQLASAAAIFFTVFTNEIYQTPLPRFVFI